MRKYHVAIPDAVLSSPTGMELESSNAKPDFSYKEIDDSVTDINTSNLDT